MAWHSDSDKKSTKHAILFFENVSVSISALVPCRMALMFSLMSCLVLIIHASLSLFIAIHFSVEWLQLSHGKLVNGK